MTELVAALPQLAVLGQDALHGADRTEIRAFVDQRGVDLRRGLVAETFRVQMVEDHLSFGGVQGAPRRGAKPVRDGRLQAAIQRGAGHAEGAAGGRLADTFAQLQGGAHEFSSPIWMFGIGLPRRAATFFWTSMINSAFFSFLLRRALLATSLLFSSTSGLTTTLGPRFLGVRASNSPCFRCRLQVVRCEEERPSRRNRAPTTPES